MVEANPSKNPMKPGSPLCTEVRVKYDDAPRLDVVGLIQTAPRHVLEIGCAAGATGIAVKERFPGCRYTGIEMDPGFCSVAQTRIDRCIQRNIDTEGLDGLGLESDPVDLVICADVLEHLYDPWTTLQALRGLIAEGGQLIASIPNVQHFSVIQGLVEGEFRYQPHGLLDATHIRFFTRRGILELFEDSGWVVQDCVRKMTGAVDWNQLPGTLTLGRVLIRDATRENAEDLLTFQYLIRSRPRATPTLAVTGTTSGG